jgi:hypothetical protein
VLRTKFENFLGVHLVARTDPPRSRTSVVLHRCALPWWTKEWAGEKLRIRDLFKPIVAYILGPN